MVSLMRVRVRGTDLWVGKRSPSYAFQDASRNPGTLKGREAQGGCYFWVGEKYAKVWTDLKALKAVSTMGRDGDRGFPDLEVVFADGTVKPLDEVCPPPS